MFSVIDYSFNYGEMQTCKKNKTKIGSSILVSLNYFQYQQKIHLSAFFDVVGLILLTLDKKKKLYCSLPPGWLEHNR